MKIKIEARSAIYCAEEIVEEKQALRRLVTIRDCYKLSRKIKLRKLEELFKDDPDWQREIKARKKFLSDKENKLTVVIQRL